MRIALQVSLASAKNKDYLNLKRALKCNLHEHNWKNNKIGWKRSFRTRHPAPSPGNSRYASEQRRLGVEQASQVMAHPKSPGTRLGYISISLLNHLRVFFCLKSSSSLPKCVLISCSLLRFKKLHSNATRRFYILNLVTRKLHLFALFTLILSQDAR